MYSPDHSPESQVATSHRLSPFALTASGESMISVRSHLYFALVTYETGLSDSRFGISICTRFWTGEPRSVKPVSSAHWIVS